jgi:hypothetical protein
MTPKKLFLLALCVVSISFLSLVAPASKVLADRLESDSYVIQFGNFNVTSGEKSSASYNVTDTVGQTAVGPFGQYGSSSYFVGAGFQYIYQIDTFAFSISDVLIELGSLSSSAFSTDTNILTITTRGGGGYTVYAYETEPLTLSSDGSTTIADTTCDTSSCDETNADPWTIATNTGFGFNADGSTVPSDFVDTTYFRQFADNSSAETMQAVMSSSNIANSDTATITYKASIPGSQTAGDYETAIVYVAVPGF